MFDLLGGARIVDLTSVVLGPYATQILGDMGADVIKVEAPAGDVFRSSSKSRTSGMSAGYMNCNRNKRSIVLDLKSRDGRDVMLDLVRGADVFIHNMRPDALDRLGLSYNALREINPKLVFCAGPGYGQNGPYASYPAYDDVIQAMAGIGHLNSSKKAEPRFFPTIIGDKIGGLHLALAVLGGLVRRNREGVGCYIEAPMFESVLSFLYVEHLAGLTFEPPEGGSGYHRVMNPYRKPYKTKDDYIAVLPYNSKQWSRFFVLAGRDDLAQADWVTNSEKRSQNITRLYKLLETIMLERTTQEWLDGLMQQDIPCAPVNNLDGLLEDKHLVQTDFFHLIDHPTEGEIRTVRSPFLTQGVGTSDDTFAPKLGQHSCEILHEIGVSEDRITQLLREGVVGEAQDDCACQ